MTTKSTLGQHLWALQSSTGGWAERSGGPKGAWNAGKSPPLVSFCSECCSNSYFPCVEQPLLPHGAQDVHLDSVCQGITALSQGGQAVPADPISEQHRARSAQPGLAHRQTINTAEVNPASATRCWFCAASSDTGRKEPSLGL